MGRVSRRARLVTAAAQGCVTKPSGITGTATYLASKDGDDMTAQIVKIDGGMTLI